MPRPWMTVGLHLPPKPPVYALRGALYAARALRLESLTVWDHVQDLFPTSLWTRDFSWLATQSRSPHDFFEFQVTLGYLAAHAGRLRLGVGVTEPVRRHPVLIAQSMATLAHFARRAPILGIGTGERENTEPLGLSLEKPASRLEEALQIIRMCLSPDGPINFQGEHFQIDRLPLDLAPPKKRVPEIWVAAHGPRMLRLTGQYGDGWLPVAITDPADYAGRLDTIRRAARAAGRDPSAVRPAIQTYVVVAPTEREARAMLDTKVIRFVAVLAPAELWRQAGVSHPFGDDFKGFVDFMPEHWSRADLEEAIAAVPADALASAIVWGTPEMVAERLRAFGHAGARHVNLELVSAAVSRKAALFGVRAAGQIARRLRNPDPTPDR